MVSHLSACTLEDLTRRYAYFLSFLTKQGRLNPHEPAASSVTEENILLYVRYLEPRVSSVTLAQSLYKISRVAACLAPEQDWRWLKRVARRLDLRAKPRDKRHEVVEIKALFELGLQLMNEAEEADTSEPPSKGPALSGWSNHRPARRQPAPPRQHYGARDWQDLGQGRDDLEHRDPRRGDQGASPAPRRACPIGVCLASIDMLHHYRPLLRNAETTSRLWLGRSGRPLSEAGLYRLVCKRTRAAFGKRINLHLFRSCLITSTAVHHGAQMGLAMTVLRHQSSKVTERHYNQAKMIDAVRAYQEMLLDDPQS